MAPETAEVKVKADTCYTVKCCACGAEFDGFLANQLEMDLDKGIDPTEVKCEMCGLEQSLQPLKDAIKYHSTGD